MPTGYNKDGSHNGVKTQFKKGCGGFTGRHTEATKLKISLKKKGCLGTWNGRKHTKEAKLKMRSAKLGKKQSPEAIEKRVSKFRGKNHYMWSGGFKLRGHHTLFDPTYKNWRMEVFKRDNFKCRIANNDCDAKLEAHHILNWKDYEELRFEINNGITLCHAHHPRGRAKEKQLEPVFQALVLASKEPLFPN